MLLYESFQCKSSDSMIPFLPKCFTENQSIDPMIWVLIALALIGGVLLLAILVTIEYRKRRQRSLLEALLQRTSNEKTIQTTTTTTTTLKDHKRTNSVVY